VLNGLYESAVPAAVDVGAGALLLVRDGARAHFRYGIIERAQALENGAGGFGIVAPAAGTELELSNFVITRAELAGMLANRTYVKASDGLVSRNLIGAALQE